jgi:hypothetical protein
MYRMVDELVELPSIPTRDVSPVLPGVLWYLFDVRQLSVL